MSKKRTRHTTKVATPPKGREATAPVASATGTTAKLNPYEHMLARLDADNKRRGPMPLAEGPVSEQESKLGQVSLCSDRRRSCAG
jgi:hypothetical protein